MKRAEAIHAVSALLGLGLAGLGTALKATANDDLFAGIGLSLLCAGLYLQYRHDIGAAMRDVAATPPPSGEFRGMPRAMQIAGVVLIYAGIAAWAVGRN